jgi:hypothetical protein
VLACLAPTQRTPVTNFSGEIFPAVGLDRAQRSVPFVFDPCPTLTRLLTSIFATRHAASADVCLSLASNSAANGLDNGSTSHCASHNRGSLRTFRPEVCHR